MTMAEMNDTLNEQSRTQPWWAFTIGTIGLPAVMAAVWMFAVYLPDQDARREIDRQNAATLAQMGQAMQMLVDQDRRREQTSGELLRGMQEQTRLLQQIMLDQRNGAWRDPKKLGSHAVGLED